MSEETKNRIVPNTFQTPNAHVDEVMAFLTGDEYKVLNFATRHIMGWQDTIADRMNAISLSVFEDGFVTKTGKHFGGCGLSRPTIVKVLAALEAFGLLTKVGKPNSKGQVWRLAETIDWNRLMARQAEKEAAGRERTEKARQTRAVNGANQQVVNPINREVVNETNRQGLVPLTSGGKSDLLNQSHLQTHSENHQQIDAAAAAKNIFELYEEAFGEKAFDKMAASALLRDDLKDIEAEYAQEMIAEAFRQTALSGANAPIKYALAILKRMQADEDRKQAIAEAARDGITPGLSTPKPEAAAPEGMEREFDWWNATRNQLEIQLDRANFDTWLRDTEFGKVERGVAAEDGSLFNRYTIRVRNEYAVQNLQHRLYKTVRRVLRDISGNAVEVVFVTGEAEATE